MASCASCGAAVENPAVTGILCQACYVRDVAPQPAWKAYVSGPAAAGLGALVLTLLFSFRINRFEYFGLGMSAFAVAAGVAGILQSRKNEPEWRTPRAIGSAAVIALGLLRFVQFLAAR